MEFVLSDEEARGLETVDVWVADVAPAAVSAVLARFARNDSLAHLKRIRKGSSADCLSILLAPVTDDDNDNAAQVRERLAGIAHTLGRTAVPRWPPLTRAQYTAWRPAWPLYWRESAARGDPLTDDDRRAYAALVADDLVRGYVAQLEADTPLAAGLVYDPRTGAVVARAHDTRGAHPLQHTAMNLLAAVARQRRQQHHPPRPKRKANDDDPYLCAGLTVVLTHEPCVMCAMALLHSRVGGVVYAVAAPHTGALGSRAKVHTEPRLNHKFSAWRHCARDAVVTALGDAQAGMHY